LQKHLLFYRFQTLHIGESLNQASISITLKAMQKDIKMNSDEQTLSGHSFRVGAALDLLEQGEPLERIMLRGDGRQIRLP